MSETNGAMPKVKLINDKQEIEVPAGGNLRKELRKAGVQVYVGKDRFLNCMGMGLCGTCRVLVKKGMENLTPKTRRERFRLAISMASIGHEQEMRLSCQAQVLGDCEIETRPEPNFSGENFWQKPYPNK